MAAESQRIAILFKNLYNGNPWIDVSIIDSLKKITAAQAAKKPFANTNSVWQLVAHLLRWREHNMKRIHGEVISSPKDNYLTPPTDTSEAAWNNVLLELEQSQKAWLKMLSNLDDETLNKKNGSASFTNYDLIHGILQHDAYHLGQINLLKKFV
jgi:uncharacterized damage-inducible protein DinB